MTTTGERDRRAVHDRVTRHASGGSLGTAATLMSKVLGMAALTTDAARPSRGGRPRDPSRDGVIRAAILRLLAEVGYGALTMDAVASEAGVGKATIYRRWRTKQDLVVDTISDLAQVESPVPDTGSLEEDLRAMMHAYVGIFTGPTGAAIKSLLSTIPHHPALAEAFRNGPVEVWRQGFEQVWARAEERGDVPAGTEHMIIGEVVGSVLVQRWLVTGWPLDDAVADQVLDVVVLPVIRNALASAN
jgi:AcrR family transcriptional regulator